jgi:hypothetical protein
VASAGAILIVLSLVGLVAIGTRPGLAERLSDAVDGPGDEGQGDEWGGGPRDEGWGEELPGPGMEIPPTGPPPVATGAWTVATGGTAPVGTGPRYRYRVEVETVTEIDADEVARVVDFVLGHPRGWRNAGVSFQRVDAGDVEMVIRLATPATVDQLCAPLETNGQVSCRNGIDVVLNQRRWENGVDAYAGDIESYRILLINHEVGHLLGHAEHLPCPGPGQPAPVMMPVYYTGLQGCAPNVWPYTEDGRFIG